MLPAFALSDIRKKKQLNATGKNSGCKVSAFAGCLGSLSASAGLASGSGANVLNLCLMKSITKKSARLVGSAGSLEDLLQAIRERMFWTVNDTRVSAEYTAKFGTVYDLQTGRGWSTDAVIIRANRGRWGLYFI